MRPALLFAAVLLASACNLTPLSSADVNALRPSCPSCTADQVCDPVNRQCVTAATLSGGVVSACTRVGISARVTVDGQSTCSTDGKAYFRLDGLRPGGPHRLAVGKEGYVASSVDVVLEPGFNTLADVELTPTGGCVGTLVDVACSCTAANCQ